MTAPHNDHVVGFGEFILDSADTLLVGPDGPVRLGRKAFQILELLVAEPGRLVTKETLFETVWTGVYVSESVLTVAIKELRRALGDQARSPRFIESVYGRGYRFVAPVGVVARVAAAQGRDVPPETLRHATVPVPAHTMGRRALFTGAGTIGIAMLAGLGWPWLRSRSSTRGPPREVEALVARARDALESSRDDDQDQAIALMRRVVALASRYADGWGLLGLANAVTSHFRARALGTDLRAHAEAAARRAFDIEPGNGLGELALGVALPLVGAWEARERHLERALAVAPKTVEVLEYAAVCNIFAGRASAALPLYDRMPRPFQPQTFANYCQALWRTGRLEELDRALDEAAALYPAQTRLWFSRIGIYLYGGRVDRAVEMLRTPNGRPNGIPPETLAELEEIAGAVREPLGPLAGKIAARQVAHERKIPPATDAIRVLTALGRIDQAFAVVEALYFGEGYVITDWYGTAFTPEQRDSRVLFEPATRALRVDGRFEAVVARLGLDAFWRLRRVRPDYRAWGL